MVKCLTEYLGKGSADIFLFLLKLCISMVKFIKLSILSYVIWSEFWVDGYFTQVVCYVIFEAPFVPKRKIKKVYLSVFGKYHFKIKVKTIFCILKTMLSVTSNIYSRFDTIRKYFLVFKPLLSRCMKSIPFSLVNSTCLLQCVRYEIVFLE